MRRGATFDSFLRALSHPPKRAAGMRMQDWIFVVVMLALIGALIPAYLRERRKEAERKDLD